MPTRAVVGYTCFDQIEFAFVENDIFDRVNAVLLLDLYLDAGDRIGTMIPKWEIGHRERTSQSPGFALGSLQYKVRALIAAFRKVDHRQFVSYALIEGGEHGSRRFFRKRRFVGRCCSDRLRREILVYAKVRVFVLLPCCLGRHSTHDRRGKPKHKHAHDISPFPYEGARADANRPRTHRQFTELKRPVRCGETTTPPSS